MSNTQGVIKTIRWIVTSALFRLGKPVTGREYTWLEQVAIEYLSDKAPLDGNVSLKCAYIDLGSTARIFKLPTDCMRISKIALRSGNRVWTLTVDNNLAIPENVFDCTTDQDVSSEFAGFYPYSYAYGWWNSPMYTLGAGQNVRYYRIIEGQGGKEIIFSHNIPDGRLIVEYLSNGSNISGDTMIDTTYSEPFRLYLMSQYVMFKGTREEKSMYKELQIQYEAAQWEANTLAKADRIYEIIDAMAQSSEFNLG